MNAEQLASALERAAETIRRYDGLPLPGLGLRVGTHVDGSPLVIMEAVEAYWWAHYLELDPLQVDTVEGFVEWRTNIDGTWWSFMTPGRALQDDEPIDLYPTLKSPTQATQVLPIISEVR